MIEINPSQEPTGSLEKVVQAQASRFRRDWLVLSLLSLATAILVPVLLETLARLMFYQSRSDPCITDRYSPRGARGVPNSVCRLKYVPESPWVIYKFNSCGYRSDGPCGPKPKGTYRIAAFGSSFTVGYLVPIEQTYPVLLRSELSAATGRRIDVQNVGLQGRFLNNLRQHFGDVLALKPDLIVWMVTSWDIEHADMKAVSDIPKAPWQDTLRARLRTLVMFQHFLLQSPTQAVNSYLAHDDHPFLSKSTSERWQRELDLFDSVVKDVTTQAKNSGVPFVIGLVPLRPHAIMLSPGIRNNLQEDIDPWKINRDVKAITEKHGAVFVDLLPDFAAAPHVEKLFYPADEHPNAGGHALVSHSLARMLTDGRIAGLERNRGVVARASGDN